MRAFWKFGITLFLSLIFFHTSSAQDSKPPVNEFTAKISWSGDLRYRLARTKEDLDEERNFQQLRARLGFKAEFEKDLTAVVRLATGTSAISTNQTLGDSRDPGMPRRNFGLDLSYLAWRADEGQQIWIGRTANPFWAPAKNQLVYDSDLSFEGLAYKLETKWSESHSFLNAGAFMISENYDSAARQDVVDSGLVGLQIGHSEKTGWGTFSAHIAAYEYVNIQDKNITSFDAGAKTDIYSIPFDRYRGNSVVRPDISVAQYFFLHQYQIRHIGLEWEQKIDSVRVLLFADHVKNTKVGTLDEGSEAGLSVKSGRVSLSYARIEKQADSVVGAFTDSDTNGGGTDNRGTRWSLGYQLSNTTQVNFTQFQADRGIDSVERKFTGSQLDLVAGF